MIQGELTTLGLGRTEERAYEALLKEQAEGTDQLARQLGLPRERLDAALDRLVEHGFARPPDPGDEDGLPHPAAPAVAIRTLIHRRQAELHQRSAELERLRMAADQLAGRLTAGSPVAAAADRGIEVLTGRAAIDERADHLLAGARREVLILDRPPWARAGLGATGCPGRPGLDVGPLLARGVEVRAVVDRTGLALPGRARALTVLAQRGLRLRIATGVPTRLVAVDRRLTLLPPADTAGTAVSALLVGDPLLRDALVPLFDTVWERATPFGGADAPGVAPPGPQRELLALLAAGLKDEAIARRLGVHVHTARRRISRLLESLDARTRFQAGAQATSRGWLDS
ncbi:helix-turn-helix domain-containing protein [Streptomyces sp. SP18CS02]|uniref:helix-turn-helix domain-containing protein n=1 Tax=Streptomyces sp. SP18CS02 TaxID=3002531 RepID=UPI002E79A517|nr:helix-turn-helix domain-containing protein [Streptomyces sp. SP18CS02]MEE1757241.1 helix-turn-helix domain-containing protein [Streptomyces sp. SP18CS02]